MNPNELQQRTKKFGIRIVKLIEALPKNTTTSVMGRQLLRSATSVGANYRAVCRARSRADFVAKLGVVEEECDNPFIGSKCWSKRIKSNQFWFLNY
ncbi:MAG TPA: four helix bundle protein [Verrucomicrobiae bacterium]